MLEKQRQFQRRLNGYDVDEQTDEQRIENFKSSMFALIAELYEAVNEMGWKSWALSNHFNTQRVQEELVDAWHFFMNLMLHAGLTGDDLWKLYARKLEVNFQRQDDKYDGVATKCMVCKRELSETALKEVHVAFPVPHVNVYCVCGQRVATRTV
jgi:hypothetical protein